ncbi:hypothetical protein ACJMK2_000001 [Sinanodonta woodiana]|uniref:Uncharacterized protein n=2 Tax=Sinanodonta woodiana TaxID=1069815 RepID=A0ABD3XRI7_SINWO
MASDDENRPSRMNTDVPSTSGSTHYQKLHSEQVLVMGVPSDRPELGIYTATMQQNKEWTSNLRRNLELCHAAVTRQSAFCHLLQRTTSPETSYMFLLEKSIMDMAISGLSEGCVYGVVFRQGRLSYMRFFESGIFSGFFKSKVFFVSLQSQRNYHPQEDGILKYYQKTRTVLESH